MKRVDVVVNVFGKPWQTLCTLKSLIKHSGSHIDKIFLIKEKNQPENIDFIFDYFDNVIVYTPDKFSFITKTINHKDQNERFVVRYQYGIENSNKKYVFLTHNDVLYTGDIIGEMLGLIGDNVGIGQIGQCWNCPAKSAGVCSGEKFNEWNPTKEDIFKLPLPHLRTNIEIIDLKNPKPMPECRLNEWACLLNKEIIMEESKPNGECSLFGQYGLDLGTTWFRDMYLKGYNFVDYRKNFIHSYWSESASGFQTQLKKDLYDKSEEMAKKYYEENFK
jgi:hypothetical protein